MPYNPDEILLDKYRIEALLGQGAFGDVYRVLHLNLRTQRAIKVLRRDAPGIGSTIYANAQQRFMLEGQLGAKLHNPMPNPHLLQVYDFIVREDLLVLEMEYAAGSSLAERIKKQKETKVFCSLEEALQIAADVAAGLGALHAMDIVHRDIKPANILFDEHGHARLADLGLAQVPGGPSLRSQLSEPNPHPGTPGYMSPEQESTGVYLTPASDVYSLGVSLFELLTGRFYRSLRPGTRVQSLRADIPNSVDEVMARMLSKLPEDRPWDGAETAGLLAEELGRLQSGQGKVQPEAEEKNDQGEQIARLKMQAEAAEKALLVEKQARLDLERRLGSQEAAQKAQVPQARVENQVPVVSAAAGKVVQTSAADLMLELARGVMMEFVRVPAGEFLMGSDKKKDKQARDDETPQHNVMLGATLIGKYPVTNREYRAFVMATGYRQPGHWENGEIPAGKQEHPVVNVSWQDAVAFCEWGSQASGQKLRLPSEAEWEYAARGTDGRTYPWGEGIEPSRANYAGDDTMAVGSYASGASPYGVLDMVGNVFEWVADWYGPYTAGSVSNPSGPASGDRRVLRGGSWSIYGDNPRSARRDWVYPSNSDSYLGFRCSRSLPF